MWNIYIRRGRVFIPSQFKSEAGFYVSKEPIYVSDLSDIETLKHCIAKTIAHGSPIIATPPVRELEKWAVLKYAGVPSVAAFEKGASCWTIHKDESSYRFGSVKKILPRGWESEPEAPCYLSNNLPIIDVAEEIAKRIWDSGKGPVSR